MLCEICKRRPANVHEEHTTIRRGLSRTTTKRDLCEVCAGRKTEEQWQAEEAARWEQCKAKMERRKLAVAGLIALIRSELFDSRKTELQSAQVRSYGSCVDPYWELCLLVVGSKSPAADPLEALFGQTEKGKTHAVRQVPGCEVHVVRWNADPVRLMENVFIPFPAAGARLDSSNRLLLVEGELVLFPNTFRSLTFCTLAASAIGLSSVTSDERIRYRFEIQKPARLADRRSFPR